MPGSNKNITIFNEEIPPGTHKVLELPIGALPTGTPIQIPLYVFNAKKPGPNVLFQGGLHGDEINGVEICKRMLVNGYFNDLQCGSVIVIPLLNVYGFIHFSREVTNGKDVNRSFPGGKTGSMASRIAYYHTREILSDIDFGVDFHTGGAMRSNYPQVRFTPDFEESRALAEIFNAPFQFESKLIRKSFRATAAKKNIPIIVYEGGESMRFDEHAIHQGINGALRLLVHHKMLPKDTLSNIATNTSVELTDRRWIRARKAGIFTPYIENGKRIEKDQVLGFITDAYGTRNTAVKAPFDGYVFCVNNHPLVSQGDALFHIGKTK